MKSFIAITALAVLMACQVHAHSETLMNDENEVFYNCWSDAISEACEIERQYMECEPASNYEKSWDSFITQNGLSDVTNSGIFVHSKLGPINFITVRMNRHYAHTYTYIALEEVVCLTQITHFLDDPA